jgi:hypothetical protein
VNLEAMNADSQKDEACDDVWGRLGHVSKLRYLGRLRDWWGTEDKFKVLEEERLEKELLERKDSSTVTKLFSLVLSMLVLI